MPEPLTSRALARADRALRRAADAFTPQVQAHAEGRVIAVGDGLARIAGLPEAGMQEVLRIEPGARALVLGLEPDSIMAVVLDDAHRVAEDARVRATGEPPRIGAGEALLGRVVDPLGRPLDGGPPLRDLAPMPLERPAPSIHERGHVRHPLYTGTLAIDAMFPIGRGQRELILGDEGTGKTSLAVDALLRQRDTGVVGVYAAIGRRRSETWRVVDALRRNGGRWVVVAAPEDESPGLRYLAAFAACAVAEHFMERGGDALVVYDDLSAHAVAWRELSLLMRRPPGREAYPGDVFYLHSRLLERATQLSKDRGGGSLTALPIARLESGRLSAYVPTNLISITDGQIVLSSELFAAGQKPAVDVGLSVSRVGGKAQAPAVRELAGRLRLDFASFLDLEVFARLGTRLEASTERRLALGRRIRALLRARPGTPLPLFDEVALLLLASLAEHVLAVPEDRLGEVAASLRRLARAEAPDVVERVEREEVLSQADRDRLARLVARIAPAEAAA